MLGYDAIIAQSRMARAAQERITGLNGQFLLGMLHAFTESRNALQANPSPELAEIRLRTRHAEASAYQALEDTDDPIAVWWEGVATGYTIVLLAPDVPSPAALAALLPRISIQEMTHAE